MNQSELTVDEVMNKIKEAMRIEKKSTLKEDRTDNFSEKDFRDNLSEFDLENRNNNIKWNIMSEWLITSHRKVIGWFIVFGKKVVRKFLRWYIIPFIDQQREFNGSVTRSLNVAGDILHTYASEFDSLKIQIHEIASYRSEQDESEIHELVERSEQDKAKIHELIERSEQDEAKIHELIERSEKNKAKIHELVENVELLLQENTNLKEQYLSIENVVQTNIKGLYEESAIVNDRLRRMERKINKGLGLDIQIPTINKLVEEDKSEQLDIDYFLFEQRFRGSREEIKKRQQVYVPYFSGKSNVLDFGCGRGEFVELLLENRINVKGIDVNQDMIAYCQDRGLPVIEADGLEYLGLQDDNSLGGLFAAQVIEHLSTDKMIKMVRLAFKKLKPGGCLILETINLYTLLVFANQFYMDPSHNKPVHPETIKFILQSEGFKNIQFIYSGLVEDRFVPPLDIKGAESNVKEFNAGIDNINNLLFGNQDYAIIAYR